MPRPKREIRNDRLYCPGCKTWLHYSRFSPKRQTGNDELLYDLGWLELEDWVQASIDGNTKCINCLHPFQGQDDVQIDIRDPVRSPDDRARLARYAQPTLDGASPHDNGTMSLFS